MIAYIDTSTLLKLIIEENGSERAMTIWSSADAAASVSLVVVEARAALAAALTVEATVPSSVDTALCAAAARRGLHIANPLGS